MHGGDAASEGGSSSQYDDEREDDGTELGGYSVKDQDTAGVAGGRSLASRGEPEAAAVEPSHPSRDWYRRGGGGHEGRRMPSTSSHMAPLPPPRSPDRPRGGRTSLSRAPQGPSDDMQGVGTKTAFGSTSSLAAGSGTLDLVRATVGLGINGDAMAGKEEHVSPAVHSKPLRDGPTALQPAFEIIYTSKSSPDDAHDVLFMTLLAAQAAHDVREFPGEPLPILSPEDVDTLTTELRGMQKRLESLRTALSVDKKTREATTALARLPESSMDHQIEYDSGKAQRLAEEEAGLVREIEQKERSLLRHQTAVLAFGFRRLEERERQKTMNGPAASPLGHSRKSSSSSSRMRYPESIGIPGSAGARSMRTDSHVRVTSNNATRRMASFDGPHFFAGHQKAIIPGYDDGTALGIRTKIDEEGVNKTKAELSETRAQLEQMKEAMQKLESVYSSRVREEKEKESKARSLIVSELPPDRLPPDAELHDCIQQMLLHTREQLQESRQTRETEQAKMLEELELIKTEAAQRAAERDDELGLRAVQMREQSHLLGATSARNQELLAHISSASASLSQAFGIPINAEDPVKGHSDLVSDVNSRFAHLREQTLRLQDELTSLKAARVQSEEEVMTLRNLHSALQGQSGNQLVQLRVLQGEKEAMEKLTQEHAARATDLQTRLGQQDEQLRGLSALQMQHAALNSEKGALEQRYALKVKEHSQSVAQLEDLSASHAKLTDTLREMSNAIPDLGRLPRERQSTASASEFDLDTFQNLYNGSEREDDTRHSIRSSKTPASNGLADNEGDHIRTLAERIANLTRSHQALELHLEQARHDEQRMKSHLADSERSHRELTSMLQDQIQALQQEREAGTRSDAEELVQMERRLVLMQNEHKSRVAHTRQLEKRLIEMEGALGDREKLATQYEKELLDIQRAHQELTTTSQRRDNHLYALQNDFAHATQEIARLQRLVDTLEDARRRGDENSARVMMQMMDLQEEIQNLRHGTNSSGRHDGTSHSQPPPPPPPPANSASAAAKRRLFGGG